MGHTDSARPTSVFINAPYQASPKYEGRFISIIAATVALGMEPRAAAQIPENSKGRLDRIIHLISECTHSIHELSPPPGLPRFNMPFELGIAVAINRTNSKHQFVLLESDSNRLQKTLSDLRRYDPYIHENTYDSVIAKTLEAFYVKDRKVHAREVSKVAKKVRKVAPELKAQHLQDTIYNPPVFNDIVECTLEILKTDGLI